MPNISLQDRGDPRAIIKGPATDASMITEMKRRSAIVADLVSNPKGRKGTGGVVDRQQTRGFNATDVRTTFIKNGSVLSFFRVN
jgi:hypothetical protein